MKKLILSLIVAISAVSFSAFKTESNKLADGDFRFYNTSTTIQNPSHAYYVYYSERNLCYIEGPACSEVWNIGTTITPSDGTALSFYTDPEWVGQVQTGSYNPD